MAEKRDNSGTTVWVVEQGQYSDYRVVGVFTSKANAKRVAEYIAAQDNWDKPTVAEWPLDPIITDLNAGRKRYRVLMLRDGKTEKVERSDSTYDLAGECSIWRRTQVPFFKGKNVPDVLDASVWADNDEHAIKIVNERRTQMIANGEWK